MIVILFSQDAFIFIQPYYLKKLKQGNGDQLPTQSLLNPRLPRPDSIGTRNDPQIVTASDDRPFPHSIGDCFGTSCLACMKALQMSRGSLKTFLLLSFLPHTFCFPSSSIFSYQMHVFAVLCDMSTSPKGVAINERASKSSCEPRAYL